MLDTLVTLQVEESRMKKQMIKQEMLDRALKREREEKD